MYAKTKMIFIVVSMLVLMARAADSNSLVPRSLGTHNLLLCNSYDGFKPVHSERVTIEGSPWKVNEYIVTYPPFGLSNKIISCIRVLDRVMNRRGGYVEIKSGGVGYRDVQIRLTSQLGRPLDFDVQIYAERPARTSTAQPSTQP